MIKIEKHELQPFLWDGQVCRSTCLHRFAIYTEWQVHRQIYTEFGQPTVGPTQIHFW